MSTELKNNQSHSKATQMPLFCEEKVNINYNDIDMTLVKKRLEIDNKSGFLTLRQFHQLRLRDEYKHTMSTSNLVDCFVNFEHNDRLLRLNYMTTPPNTSNYNARYMYNNTKRLAIINSIFGCELHFKLFAMDHTYFMLIRLDEDNYYLLPVCAEQVQSPANTDATNISMLHKEDVLRTYFLKQSQALSATQRESQWSVLSHLYDVLSTVLTDNGSKYELLKQAMLSPAVTLHFRHHQDTSKYSHVCIDEQVRQRMNNQHEEAAACYNGPHFEFLGVYADERSESDDQTQRILNSLPSMKETEVSTTDLLLFRPWYYGIIEMDAVTTHKLKCGKNTRNSEWFEIIQWLFLFLSEHFGNITSQSPLSPKVRFKFYQRLLASLISDFNKMGMKKIFFWIRLIIQFIDSYCLPLKVSHFNDLSDIISHWNKFVHDHGCHDRIDVFPGRPQIGIDIESKPFGDEFNWIRFEYFNQAWIEQLIRDYLNAKHKLSVSTSHHQSNVSNTNSYTPSNSANPRKRTFSEFKNDGNDEQDIDNACTKKRKLHDLSAATDSMQTEPSQHELASEADELIPDPFAARCKGLILIMQGIPGLGKTTLGEHVKKALMESKLNDRLFAQYASRSVITIEQDTFYDEQKDNHWNRKNSGRLCQQAFEELIKSEKYGIILLLRNNSTETQYRRYCEIGRKYGFGSIAIYPHSFSFQTPSKVGTSDVKITGLNEDKSCSRNMMLLLICLQSVLKRSKCTDSKHPTFDGLNIDKQLAIVLSFYCVFQPGTVVTKNGNNASLLSANEIHWIRDTHDETLNHEHLHTVLSQLNNYTQRVRQSPWDHNPTRLKEIKQLIETLKLESVDYQKYRLSPQQIAQNVVRILSSKQYESVSSVKIELPHLRVSYFGLFWNKNIINYLNRYLRSRVDLVSSFGKCFNDHVTLIHYSDFAENDVTHNKCMIRMMQNPYCKVKVTGIAVKFRRMIAFVVELEDKEIASLCQSSCAHITSVIAAKEKPHHSIELIRRLKKNENEEDERLILIEQPLVFFAQLSAKLLFF